MEFKQLTGGTPPDIEAKTSYAEAMSLQSQVSEQWDDEDGDLFQNIAAATVDELPIVTFHIPGDQAAEVGEAFLPELEEYLDELNEQTLVAAESEEE